jgi:hypothetical protein
MLLADAVKHLNVQQLPQHVSGKTGKSNAKHKGVELAQRLPAVEAPFVEQHAHHVRGQQRWQHGAGDDAPCGGFANQAHRQISSQENERKTEGAPGAVKAQQCDGQLHQVIAGNHDGNVQRHQQRKKERHARRRGQ